MVKEKLIAILGEKNVSDLETDKFAYSRDCFPLKIMQYKEGNMEPLPDYILWPESVKQISEILKIANENKIPVIPYGGGAGVNGGVIPITGGILLDVQKLDKIIDAKIGYTSRAEIVKEAIRNKILEINEQYNLKI